MRPIIFSIVIAIGILSFATGYDLGKSKGEIKSVMVRGENFLPLSDGENFAACELGKKLYDAGLMKKEYVTGDRSRLDKLKIRDFVRLTIEVRE